MKLVCRCDAGLPPLDAVGGPYVLGSARLGCGPDESPPADSPRQMITAPLLGSAHAVAQEVWLTDEACRAGEFAGIRFRRNAHVLFGVLEIDEQAFADGPSGQPLQQAAAEAYRRIFRLLDAEGLPQLWRAWNYLADINQVTNGLERYRQFNIGRHDAFLAVNRAAVGNVPAACAIGLRRGALSIAFLAGRTPAQPLENPRQISAYHYPVDYGPRSPTFSRALLVALPGQESLFISGTASIVGHRTVHVGDIGGQCREALNNIAAVVGEANRLSSGVAYSPAELSYRVYLRQADDFPIARAVLDDAVGKAGGIVFVEADICRSDLLVEIEATAVHSLPIA